MKGLTPKWATFSRASMSVSQTHYGLFFLFLLSYETRSHNMYLEAACSVEILNIWSRIINFIAWTLKYLFYSGIIYWYFLRSGIITDKFLVFTSLFAWNTHNSCDISLIFLLNYPIFHEICVSFSFNFGDEFFDFIGIFGDNFIDYWDLNEVLYFPERADYFLIFWVILGMRHNKFFFIYFQHFLCKILSFCVKYCLFVYNYAWILKDLVELCCISVHI